MNKKKKDVLINYGISKLKKNHRYPTAKEALNAKQVRYWGLKELPEGVMNFIKRAENYKKMARRLKLLTNMIYRNGKRVELLKQKIERLEKTDLDFPNARQRYKQAQKNIKNFIKKVEKYQKEYDTIKKLLKEDFQE